MKSKMKKLLLPLLLTTLTSSCIFVIVDRVDEDTAEKLEESATVYPVEHETEYGPQPVAEESVAPQITPEMAARFRSSSDYTPTPGEVAPQAPLAKGGERIVSEEQPKKSRDLTGPFTIPASLVEAELGFPLQPQPARDPRNAGTPIDSPTRIGRHPF